MASYLRLQVRHVEGKGRGVFAQQSIIQGETIEVADVIVIPKTQIPLTEATILNDYIFAWGVDQKDAALALGFGSLYNHSAAPNANHVMNVEARTIAFVALRDIGEGEEITINYDGGGRGSHLLSFVPVEE